MLVDTSNAERDVLNQLAQVRRLEAGELGSEVFQLASGLEIRAGDRVIFSDQAQDLARDLNPLGGRRVEVQRPRVRTDDGDAEVRLATESALG